MIIALFPSHSHKDSEDLCNLILDFFKQNNITVVAEEEDANRLNIPKIDSVDPKEIKFLLSMGGDGTILNIAHRHMDLDAAILGINLGHLGFMADIPISDVKASLQDLLSGAYTIENRIIIEGTAPNNKISYVLNDFVIHRAKNSSLIELSIYVDDLYLNTFEADGIILSTPNGSTAYSLAAGGPILSPSLNGVVITPICPHTISNRPIVLTTDHTIKIEYLSEYDPIEVVADGLEHFQLKQREYFTFKKSDKVFKLVNLNRRDYFSTLRTKLGWSGKLR
ncbi:NAD(+) kinase [Candidatus Aerophobetes bacterium]|uniref:NAD kinase n=1 Tax=Aerophobetes bacterium TaxID=2030807 RepID=A0A2A4YKN6_UNCAE|nr:MAG: NAD(+) kinase [Candidatus Aerophobetes bacterium]